jgi:transcriptional regulator with XRE-family HTH domain
MKKIGVFLREGREKMGISQKEASDFAGLQSPQYISNIEREVSDPSWQVLRKLIELYQLPKKEVVDILLEQRKQLIMEKLEITSLTRKKRAKA